MNHCPKVQILSEGGVICFTMRVTYRRDEGVNVIEPVADPSGSGVDVHDCISRSSKPMKFSLNSDLFVVLTELAVLFTNCSKI